MTLIISFQFLVLVLKHKIGRKIYKFSSQKVKLSLKFLEKNIPCFQDIGEVNLFCCWKYKSRHRRTTRFLKIVPKFSFLSQKLKHWPSGHTWYLSFFSHRQDLLRTNLHWKVRKLRQMDLYQIFMLGFRFDVRCWILMCDLTES